MCGVIGKFSNYLNNTSSALDKGSFGVASKRVKAGVIGSVILFILLQGLWLHRVVCEFAVLLEGVHISKIFWVCFGLSISCKLLRKITNINVTFLHLSIVLVTEVFLFFVM